MRLLLILSWQLPHSIAKDKLPVNIVAQYRLNQTTIYIYIIYTCVRVGACVYAQLDGWCVLFRRNLWAVTVVKGVNSSAFTIYDVPYGVCVFFALERHLGGWFT